MFARNAVKAALISMVAMNAQAETTKTEDELLNEQLLEALQLRDSGDLHSAIEALEKLVNTAPRLNRARLELALAYYRAALFEDAQKAAADVLSDPNTPDAVKQTVELFLSEVTAMQAAADQNRSTVSRFFSFGIGHDTNVNAGPGSDVIDVNGAEFGLVPGSTSQSDMYASANFQLDHSYRMRGTYDIGAQPVNMLWQSNFSLYRKAYDAENNFSLDVISASTGPAILSKTDWRAALNFQADYIRLGDEPLALYTSLNPSYTQVFGPTEVTFSGQILNREFMLDIDEGREGIRIGGGVDVAHNLNADWIIQGGFNLYDQDADSENEEHTAHEVFTGFYWQGVPDVGVYGRASYKETDYEGEEPLFNTGRVEREERYVVGASRNLTSGPMAGWGLNARLTYTDNHSNISLYQFYRSDFIVEVNKRF